MTTCTYDQEDGCKHAGRRHRARLTRSKGEDVEVALGREVMEEEKEDLLGASEVVSLEIGGEDEMQLSGVG